MQALPGPDLNPIFFHPVEMLNQNNIRCSWDFLRPWDRSDSDLDPPQSWYTFHRNRRPFNYPLQEGKQAKLRWISGEFKKGFGHGPGWITAGETDGRDFLATFGSFLKCWYWFGSTTI